MAKTNQFEMSRIDPYMYLKIRGDTSIRLTKTPFGMPPGEEKVVVSTPVAWKGMKGSQFWKEAKKHGKLEDGLKSAIRISKGCAGVTGRGILGGRVVPKKVICQVERKGKAVE